MTRTTILLLLAAAAAAQDLTPRATPQDGPIAIVHATVHPVSGPSVEDGYVLFDKGVEPPKSVSYEESMRSRTGDIRIPALRMQEPLRRECEAFVTAVQTRKPPLADGRSGLEVVRALEAGAESLKSGGGRVSIERALR